MTYEIVLDNFTPLHCGLLFVLLMPAAPKGGNDKHEALALLQTLALLELVDCTLCTTMNLSEPHGWVKSLSLLSPMIALTALPCCS